MQLRIFSWYPQGVGKLAKGEFLLLILRFFLVNSHFTDIPSTVCSLYTDSVAN
jgi:hypothetical protein